jgi:hypothetical protein
MYDLGFKIGVEYRVKIQQNGYQGSIEYMEDMLKKRDDGERP